MPHDESQEGMMLTEVLIALAILSLLSLAMFRVFSDTAQIIARVETSRQRLDIAENLLSRLTEGSVSSSRSFTGQTGGHAWRIDLTPVDPVERGRGVEALSARILVDDLTGPPVLTSVVLAEQP
jgi:hypothetical protein